MVIKNDKQDAKNTFKKTKGYHPSFAFVARLLVHIENHNGNTPAKYRQDKTLGYCPEKGWSNRFIFTKTI